MTEVGLVALNRCNEYCTMIGLDSALTSLSGASCRNKRHSCIGTEAGWLSWVKFLARSRSGRGLFGSKCLLQVGGGQPWPHTSKAL